ncbi:MAG: LytR C-terminal domain-containing protein [Bacteroidota bacterium]
MDSSDTSNAPSQKSLILNAVIAFLSLLLLVLLGALVTRVIYPRIENTRAEQQSLLIGDIIQLEVLNGCGIDGIATTFTDVLRSRGFDVVETGNFEHFELQRSIVISRTGSSKNARKVADALGIDEENVLIERSDDFYLDVTLVIGHDFESLNTK